MQTLCQSCRQLEATWLWSQVGQWGFGGLTVGHGPGGAVQQCICTVGAASASQSTVMTDCMTAPPSAHSAQAAGNMPHSVGVYHKTTPLEDRDDPSSVAQAALADVSMASQASYW